MTISPAAWVSQRSGRGGTVSEQVLDLSNQQQSFTDFYYTPESGLKPDISPCPGWATTGLMHRSTKLQHYSMTSSARASNLSGTVMPSDFAVLTLITISNFVGSTTGISAGFSPLKMRPE